MSRAYDARRIAARLTSIEFAHFYRVIRRAHRRTPLGAVPSPSRFSDPEGAFAVLYASEAVRCSFWEALVRSRFDRRRRRELPLSEVEDRVVCEIRSKHALDLVDLRGDGPIRIAAPTAVAHDANHAAGRALSSRTYADVPRADGLIFASRFTDDRCVAVFDRAVGKLEVTQVSPLLEYEDFLDALDDYEITLLTPPQ